MENVNKNIVPANTNMEADEKNKVVIKLDMLKNKQPLTFAYSANHEPPEKHVLHINHFYEIYIFVQGDTDYIVGDSYFQLHHGDIIIINPYEVHKAVLKSSELYERFYLLVPTDLFDSFSFNPLHQIMSYTSQKKNLISLPEESKKKALELLYQMLRILESDTSDSGHLSAYGLFLQFITIVSNNPFEEASTHTSRLPKLIEDILKYINDNLTMINSIDQIAAHFGVSLPYLSTTFKNAIGTTANKYIQARRIAYAKSLLDKNLSVTDACYESGFNDCAYFIKIFKQHTRMTPLQYKKQFSSGDSIRKNQLQ